MWNARCHKISFRTRTVRKQEGFANPKQKFCSPEMLRKLLKRASAQAIEDDAPILIQCGSCGHIEREDGHENSGEALVCSQCGIVLRQAEHVWQADDPNFPESDVLQGRTMKRAKRTKISVETLKQEHAAKQVPKENAWLLGEKTFRAEEVKIPIRGQPGTENEGEELRRMVFQPNAEDDVVKIKKMGRLVSLPISETNLETGRNPFVSRDTEETKARKSLRNEFVAGFHKYVGLLMRSIEESIGTSRKPPQSHMNFAEEFAIRYTKKLKHEIDLARLIEKNELRSRRSKHFSVKRFPDVPISLAICFVTCEFFNIPLFPEEIAMLAWDGHLKLSENANASFRFSNVLRNFFSRQNRSLSSKMLRHFAKRLAAYVNLQPSKTASPAKVPEEHLHGKYPQALYRYALRLDLCPLNEHWPFVLATVLFLYPKASKLCLGSPAQMCAMVLFAASFVNDDLARAYETKREPKSPIHGNLPRNLSAYSANELANPENKNKLHHVLDHYSSYCNVMNSEQARGLPETLEVPLEHFRKLVCPELTEKRAHKLKDPDPNLDPMVFAYSRKFKEFNENRAKIAEAWLHFLQRLDVHMRKELQKREINSALNRSNLNVVENCFKASLSRLEEVSLLMQYETSEKISKAIANMCRAILKHRRQENLPESIKPMTQSNRQNFNLLAERFIYDTNRACVRAFGNN